MAKKLSWSRSGQLFSFKKFPKPTVVDFDEVPTPEKDKQRIW